MIDRAERIIRVQMELARREHDPLATWRFGVERVRTAMNLFRGGDTSDRIDELHMRACNLGTKTETAAAFVLACLQKRPELDGVLMPQWRGPVEGAQFVLDYKQQLLSVQAAYLRLLGKWPHHARYTGEVLSSLRIKPLGALDDEASWSVLHFLSQENRRSGVGVRADIAAFDEPPVMDILREMRKAAHANRRGIRLIGETPTIRRQWAELKTDYGDTPRRTIRRVDRERAEVRWSLEDVAEWILPRERKEQLLRIYEVDPLREARIHGDYMDTSGSCPFDIATLQLMLDECIEPRTIDWRVREEARDDEGKPNTVKVVQVEIFEEPVAGASYYMTIDPSSGVDDAKHDPYEINIGRIGSGSLVSRCGGYLSGRLVGILGAGLCRQYNGAMADPEVNDRWGVNVVEGFMAAGYSNFARERRELSPGQWSREIGFHNTGQSRPLIIGAIQSWIESWRAGVRYGECRSRKMIETLLDCILDETGKVVAAPGLHDERLITWGQLLRKAVTQSSRRMPELRDPDKTAADMIAQMIQGNDDEERDRWPQDGRPLVSRLRPRG